MSWTWFARSRKATAAKPAKGRTSRPALESLEERVVPVVNYLQLTLDAQATSATVSGTVGGGSIQQQGAGSLVDHYSGYMDAFFDDGGYGSAGSRSIQFLGFDAVNDPASFAVAGISGNWQPLPGGGSGSAPANYGAQATVIIATARLAVRNLAVTVSSGTLAVNPAGMFMANQTTLATTAGTADYNAGSFGSGTANIANQSGANQTTTQATIQDMGGGSYHLTLPILFHVMGSASGISYDVTVTGTIVANAHLASIQLGNGTATFGTTYHTAGSPVGIADPNASITSTGSGTLTSMYVLLYNRLDGDSERLNPGTVSGLTATYSVQSGVGVVTVTGSGTLAMYQAMLRSITYQDTASNPTTGLPNTRVYGAFVQDAANFYSFFQYGYIDVEQP
jgi:hypothetical protein